MVGPIIGSIIYTYLKYANLFYCLGGILAGSMIVIFFLLPNSLNKSEKGAAMKTFRSLRSLKTADFYNVSTKKFFTIKRSLFALLTSFISMISLMSYAAILSVRLV